MKIKESSYLTIEFYGRVHSKNVSQVPNVNNLMHRRTKRLVGEGGRPPGLKIFRASASCSKIQNGTKYFNTVKNSRAHFVFQGKRKLLKNPKCKNYIQYNAIFQRTLFFRASASCS